MIKFGFSANLIRSVHSYLYDRKFYVSVDGVDSEKQTSSAGVPQGSVVGPILYTIYYADIPENDDTMLNTFADDTGVLASSLLLLVVDVQIYPNTFE